MLSDVEKSNNLMLTRLTPVAILFVRALVLYFIRCEAKFLTFAKFLIYHCLSIIFLLSVKEYILAFTFLCEWCKLKLFG